ncbi:BMP family ABC transporter substrate-binding protein [Naasia sp. SYSU D00057]|uniref:BMP family ABC transporter substrate-binding protein n=1 Tax=Naasia sp. SYSU D00057 TaxID=2817380 RepID=UPI001B318095|nr:BMP family ABC transporter substrate-binding protein [Naasia sp. SYSU D00057]
MSRQRIALVPLSALAVTALLAGCAGGSADDAAASGDDTFTYALITPGAAGDGGYIDSAIAGVELAKDELGVEGRLVEAESVSQQEGVIRSTVATQPDIILAPGLDPEALLAVAEENPDQRFGVPSDIFVDELPDNVQAFAINVHESSFLGGYIAGKMTQTKKVGAVLGIEAPGIDQFYYGYMQGVLAACPDCTVTSTYLNGEFSDPAVGQEAALALYQEGNDIIYAVAGLSGQGVFTAAEQEGAYAIGVDSNQDGDAPGTVIVSVMKRVDQTTYNLIEAALNDEFESGFVQAGMAEGVSGISWADGSTVFQEEGPEELASLVPGLTSEVEGLQQQILDGEIEVCDALNDPSSDVCAELGLAS